MRKLFYKFFILLTSALICLAFFAASCTSNRVYHVSEIGIDNNPGTLSKPLKTIQAAADLALPGDTIRVHEGIYREQINPPRGGTSDNARIVYEAAPGEDVMIKGSEIIKGWENVGGNEWVVTLNNASVFGDFNPYNDLIGGDWCRNTENQYTGMIYINGEQMIQAKDREEYDNPGNRKYFFADVNEKATILRGWFGDVNPNESTVEINVRQSCFYPTKEKINYLTIRGFRMSQAATPWAPPSARQVAMITAHWCKGWIIENNILTDSRNSGIALGKFGDEYDNTKGDVPGGTYHNQVVARALEYGWVKDSIGHHIVRYNTISKCGQAGIVGAHGCAFSIVTQNTIHTCAINQRWAGAEKAGLKFHGAVDAIISYNHIYNCQGSGGLWLDWMMQGTIVKGNLLHDNGTDLNFEVNHGPTLIYNNFFLSGRRAIKDWSNGAAYCHNIIVGTFITATQGRETPYFSPHDLTNYKLAGIPDGDDRMYNNIFVNPDMSVYDTHSPMWMAGNVYIKGGIPSSNDVNHITDPEFDPDIKITEEADGWYLEMTVDGSWNEARNRPLVSTELLGKAQTMNQAYENPDGTPITIDNDYFGNMRNTKNPTPGPFEISGKNVQRIKLKVWPVAEVNN